MAQTSFSTIADHLHGDRDQIGQVLLNVIDNAISASSMDGSAIDIRTHESFHHEQPGIMIRIRDAGTGIPFELLSRGHEPFFSSRKSHGAGLGMTICKNIIERHHGAIQLTGTVELGTIVSIWLPANQEPQLTTGDQRRADIVVTDDEQVTRKAIVKRLTRQGHHAVGYESGEALLVGLQHSIPDLVLLDLKLPGLSGLETLKYVRQLAPATLVVMLTVYGTMQDAVEAMKLGAYDFTIKSVDMERLDAVVARALDVLRLRQRLADKTCDLSVWGLDKT
jgi:CheY-like chemotaxis protein